MSDVGLMMSKLRGLLQGVSCQLLKNHESVVSTPGL